MTEHESTRISKKLALKKTGIRAINEGTCYDVTGNLRRLVRSIEGGELGQVTDCVVMTLSKRGTKEGDDLELRHWGTSALSEVHRIVQIARDRLAQ